MFSTTFILLLVAYIGLIAASIYLFVIADPEKSPMAKALTVTLPTKVWSLVGKHLGAGPLHALEFLAERALILVYCVVVFGSWSIIFFYVYPWIDSQDHLPKYHKWVGVVVFAACVVSWRYASGSSPGIISKETLARYDHFPFDNLMFVPNHTCRTRHIPRLARSKFDRFKYHENIPRFDHFCGWVHNTIGEENYRWFLLFLAVHVGMCGYGFWCLWVLYAGVVVDQKLLQVTFFDRYSGEEIESSYWIVVQYLFHRYFLESCVFCLMGIMCVALGMFLGYHVWITSRGMTTNESGKWDQIKRWYSRELRRYNEAVKDGVAVESTPKTPVVGDGDVTCTPGSGATPVVVEEDEDEDAAVHPGPRPVNIYNRGFVENWKEVLFPISLRHEDHKPKNKNI